MSPRHLIAMLLLASLLTASPAKAQANLDWNSSELTLGDAIADDLNRDGKLEIIGLQANSIAVINSSGELEEVLGLWQWPPRPGDLDGDGFLEIAALTEGTIATGSSSTQLIVYKKNWIGWRNYYKEQGPKGTLWAIADLNNDGKMELVAYPDGKELRVYSGSPLTPTLKFQAEIPSPGSLGDVDGDGIIELIAKAIIPTPDGEFLRGVGDEQERYNNDLLIIKSSNGAVMIDAPRVANWTRLPITVDMKNTGRDDIVLFVAEGFRVIRDGAIAFQIDMNGGFFGGAVGDFHAAEGIEMVLLEKSGVVKALDSDGATIWEVTVAPVSGQPVIADLNNDGDQEIVLPVADGRLVALRGHDGSMAFEVATALNPKHVLVADVDGNGKLDLLVSASDGLSLYNTDSTGDIQWATANGDAQGTNSYRLSREYVTRVRNPSKFSVFPLVKAGIILGVVIFLALIALLVWTMMKRFKEAASHTVTDKSVLDAEKLYMKFRNDPTTVKRLADEYASREVTDLKAIEVYQKALRIAPNDSAILRALALAFLIRNALNPESEQIYQKAIVEAPNDKRMITSLATLYSQNKRIDAGALKIYEKFYYLGLDNPRTTTLVSRELAKQHSDEPFAMYIYQRQLKAEPADNEVLAAILDHERSINNPEEYLLYANPALKLPALSHELRLKMAGDLTHWEYFDDAEAILQKAVQDHPDDPVAWRQLKDTLVSAGKSAESAKAANRLVQIYTDLQRANPTLAEYKMSLAKLFRELGDAPAAVSQLKTIPLKDPNYPEAAIMLAELFVELGDLEKATTFFDTVPGAAEHHPALRKKIDELRASKIFSVAGADAGRTAVFSDGATKVEGTSSGRYKIVQEIGRGGMGVVYKALDTVLNREVAYKILPEDLRDHPKIAESFAREAQALAQLSHPNIVTIFDAGRHGGTMYFVMQYIQGMDLREELKKEGRLTIPRITEIAKQLCGALAYAHEKRIVHRDIKTSNVMIKPDGSVMLMDFGLSKFVEESAGTKTSVSGTPYYMSPEQTLGEGVDYRTDIYSLGVMLYELATGRVPFTSGDIGYHHIHTQPTPPNVVNPDVPDSLSDIILKCIAKDKDARYQSAGEIINALDFVI